MKLDELKGGAIDKRVRFSEPAAPVPERDYRSERAVVTDSDFDYLGSRQEFYRDTYDYRPRNLQPMSSYSEHLRHMEEDRLVQQLQQGLSGFGARKDDHDVVKATVHTLKRHPKLLSIYMNS